MFARSLGKVKTWVDPYSFVDFLSLLLGQPIQRIRVLHRTMRLRRRRLRHTLLLLLCLRTLRNAKVSGCRGAEAAVSRERGCAEGHRICVDGAIWELGARVGARREGLAGGHCRWWLRVVCASRAGMSIVAQSGENGLVARVSLGGSEVVGGGEDSWDAPRGNETSTSGLHSLWIDIYIYIYIFSFQRCYSHSTTAE